MTTNYLTSPPTLRSWLLTHDHKRIAILYLFSILTAFALGGLFAIIVRTQLLAPNGTIFTTNTQYDHYNQIFTLHGAIMIFLVLIPGIPSILGNFILPIMLGAKDVAFPRLNLLSYYLYVAGAAIVILSIILGAVDTGWTFYTPYSSDTDIGSQDAVSVMVFGIFVLGFSSILTGLNFIVSIHKLRTPGMTWFGTENPKAPRGSVVAEHPNPLAASRNSPNLTPSARIPLFLWALYATAIIQVLATPILAITLLLLIMERTLHVGIFSPRYGGDPILFQHFFWFYSHPAVYIMILPAMGIITEVIPTFSRKPIFGYKAIATSSLAIAIIGFLVWGHHMFPNGQSTLVSMIFSFLTMCVAIPSAIKVWNWLATMYKGSISLQTPMCYALAFLTLFTIGGLTGIFLGTLSINIHVHDTYFVVAHFHYVMFGGTLMGFLAGLHYWWPKITGKLYNENLARLACALIAIGFITTFLPQFIAGSQGMPRRSATYLPQFETYHILSSLGAYLQLLGFILAAATLTHSLFRGKKAPQNPWGGATLEWTCPSPPPPENFTTPPTATDPYDHSNLIWLSNEEGYRRK